jgi:hypothetical protein
VNQEKGGSVGGRLEIRADEPGLTPFAGLAVVGVLERRLALCARIDSALARVPRVRPVKQRRRGVSAGELVVSLAELQLVGGSCFDDLEDLRHDRVGAGLRALSAVPSAPCARQLAARFRRSQVQAIERALAEAGAAHDRALGREPGDPVTLDFDATVVEVYGRRKRGSARGRQGTLAYVPHVAVWAERGRPLASELLAGRNERLSGAEAGRFVRRTLRLLPDGHGEVRARLDSAYYSAELVQALRGERARFSISLPRTGRVWETLERVDESDWRPALGMEGAEVAETSFSPTGWEQEPLRLIVRRIPFGADELSRSEKARRRRTLAPGQLQLALAGELDSVYGYSFILTDLDGEPAELELHHRNRAQIEERLKEAKLGQALRHFPSGNLDANRFWLQACMMALTLTSLVCDLCPAAAASGQAAAGAPVRRSAKTLRRLLFCVPGRIVRTGRKTILRLAAGFRFADVFAATYAAAWSLPPP